MSCDSVIRLGVPLAVGDRHLVLCRSGIQT